MSAREKNLLGSAGDSDEEEYDGEAYDPEMREISLDPDVFGSFALKILRPMTTCRRCSHSVFALLLVTATLYIQTAFVWAMIPAISQDELVGKHQNVSFNAPGARMTEEGQVQPDEDHKCNRNDQTNLFAEWRCDTNGGGADTSFDDQTARAKYTCNGKEWSFQESELDNFIKYAQPVEAKLLQFMGKDAPKGGMFGVLALILWSATIVGALRSAGAFSTIIWAENNLADQTEEGFADLSPGPVSKIVLAVVALLRLFIIATLGVYGGEFLAHTDNLKDFILNSVALGFVVDIPVVFFNAFASAVEKVEMDNYNQPQPGGKAVLSAWVPKIVWEHSGMMSLLVASLMFCFHFIKLVTFANNMQNYVVGPACYNPQTIGQTIADSMANNWADNSFVGSQ